MANFNLTPKNYFSKCFAFVAIALALISVVPLVNADNNAPVSVVDLFNFTSLFGGDKIDSNRDEFYSREVMRPAYNGDLSNLKKFTVNVSTVNTKGKCDGVVNQIENVYLYGEADFSAVEGKYLVTNAGAWYSADFSIPLPACLDTSYKLENCPTNSRLDRAGATLNFLGQEYQVTYLTVSNSAPKQITSITLSNVSHDQYVSVGSEIIASNKRIVVTSINPPQSSSSPIIIGLRLSVVPDTGRSSDITVNAGAQPTDISGDLSVQVPNAFYVQGGNSTARIIVVSGARFNLTSGVFFNEAFSGKWKAHFVTANNGASEAISAIQLGNDLEIPTLKPNDKLEIIKGNPFYYWQFKGLSLTNRYYDMLTIEPKNLNNIKVKSMLLSKCALVTVQFKSQKVNAFELGTNGEKGNYAWYVVKDNTRRSLGNSRCQSVVGKFIYKKQLPRGTPQTGEYQIGTATFNYSYAVNEKVPISVAFNAPAVAITIPEQLSETNSGILGLWQPAFELSANGRELTYAHGDKISYSVPVGRSAADQSDAYFGVAPFYSPRGSKVTTAPTATKFVINYATKLGKAQYVLVKNNVVANAR